MRVYSIKQVERMHKHPLSLALWPKRRQNKTHGFLKKKKKLQSQTLKGKDLDVLTASRRQQMVRFLQRRLSTGWFRRDARGFMRFGNCLVGRQE